MENQERKIMSFFNVVWFIRRKKLKLHFSYLVLRYYPWKWRERNNIISEITILLIFYLGFQWLFINIWGYFSKFISFTFLSGGTPNLQASLISFELISFSLPLISTISTHSMKLSKISTLTHVSNELFT